VRKLSGISIISDFHISFSISQTAMLGPADCILPREPFPAPQDGLSPCAQNSKSRTPVFSAHSTKHPFGPHVLACRFRCIIALPLPRRHCEGTDPSYHPSDQSAGRVAFGQRQPVVAAAIESRMGAQSTADRRSGGHGRHQRKNRKSTNSGQPQRQRGAATEHRRDHPIQHATKQPTVQPT
jgi:hypothetical protein